MDRVEELEAKIEDLRIQVHAIGKGDELKTKAAGFRLGSMRIYEDVAGILRTSGKITCHYGTAAERQASSDYQQSVFWWESDNEDLYMGTGAAWQMIGGASGAAEAVAAVEAEDPLDLAGVLNMVEISTPSNPAINIVSIFARANGSNIEVIALSSTGAEAVLCTLADTAYVNVLTINWIE